MSNIEKALLEQKIETFDSNGYIELTNGISIKLTDNQIAQIEKSFVELNKTTAEQRFLQIVNGAVVKIDKEKYPNSIFFFKGDEVLFELETSTLWTRYKLLWKIFEDEFGMQYDDIQSFIKEQVERHFKMNDVLPRLFIVALSL